MTCISDGDLLVRHQAGDDRALATVFERYRTPVYQYLLGVLRDHHQAEDALQETFVRALERLEGVDPDHLRGWLFTVAYHQAMLARRRHKARLPSVHEPNGALADPGPAPWLQAAAHDDARRLRELL